MKAATKISNGTINKKEFDFILEHRPYRKYIKNVYFCLSKKDLSSIIIDVRNTEGYNNETHLRHAKVISYGILGKTEINFTHEERVKKKAHKIIYIIGNGYKACRICKIPVNKSDEHLACERDRTFSSSWDCPEFNDSAKTTRCSNCLKRVYNKKFHVGRCKSYKCKRV